MCPRVRLRFLEHSIGPIPRSLFNQRPRTLLNLDTMRFLCVLFCLFISMFSQAAEIPPAEPSSEKDPHTTENAPPTRQILGEGGRPAKYGPLGG
ncbi:uncharacterized protein PGTG_05720 [Puccinia graminis f. sp. tritici CRL 75-36-700-3]|uniref:Uncharacterized protein n=1 Tax=Puccinia graminis f. sp. tritici (strain CRL 75-36-700-3 / race SCCL) TaxID=418459 RepID=E3K4C1_PUCGT|nr:uncharacterized protein PGTG_05720 [Puccinia graminis f. sp. tritici CRL 75-36-700-3]EFP79399.1 hypothetical protein PGTG_05720 [Puccinia graminis f. sp. tritici CRL 75-36-700-3]